MGRARGSGTPDLASPHNTLTARRPSASQESLAKSGGTARLRLAESVDDLESQFTELSSMGRAQPQFPQHRVARSTDSCRLHSHAHDRGSAPFMLEVTLRSARHWASLAIGARGSLPGLSVCPQ